MAYQTIKNRLKKAQANAGQNLGRIAELIAQGAYYDELADEEKNAYCAYIGTERQALEEINGYILGTLHFPVEHKEKPITEAQFRERVREVEGIVHGFIEEYNTPEAAVQRERQYQELTKRGREA